MRLSDWRRAGNGFEVIIVVIDIALDRPTDQAVDFNLPPDPGSVASGTIQHGGDGLARRDLADLPGVDAGPGAQAIGQRLGDDARFATANADARRQEAAEAGRTKVDHAAAGQRGIEDRQVVTVTGQLHHGAVDPTGADHQPVAGEVAAQQRMRPAAIFQARDDCGAGRFPHVGVVVQRTQEAAGRATGLGVHQRDVVASPRQLRPLNAHPARRQLQPIAASAAADDRAVIRSCEPANHWGRLVAARSQRDIRIRDRAYVGFAAALRRTAAAVGGTAAGEIDPIEAEIKGADIYVIRQAVAVSIRQQRAALGQRRAGLLLAAISAVRHAIAIAIGRGNQRAAGSCRPPGDIGAVVGAIRHAVAIAIGVGSRDPLRPRAQIRQALVAGLHQRSIGGDMNSEGGARH